MRLAPLRWWALFLALFAFGCASGRESTPARSANDAAAGPEQGSPQGAMLHLYIARHGQTDWNAERRLQGQSDRPLNDVGRAQAAGLAERMRGIPLARVYSSALSRSRATAEAARGGAPLESLAGLNEQSLGKFEGVRLGVDAGETAEFERRSRDRNDDLDGGESGEAFYRRVEAVANAIVARHRSGAVLVVAHGGTNRALIRAILGLTEAQADSIRQANDEIYKLEIVPGRRPQLWKAITFGGPVGR
jgi:broad specificity phosphatase PhoE